MSAPLSTFQTVRLDPGALLPTISFTCRKRHKPGAPSANTVGSECAVGIDGGVCACTGLHSCHLSSCSSSNGLALRIP